MMVWRQSGRSVQLEKRVSVSSASISDHAPMKLGGGVHLVLYSLTFSQVVMTSSSLMWTARTPALV